MQSSIYRYLSLVLLLVATPLALADGAPQLTLSVVTNNGAPETVLNFSNPQAPNYMRCGPTDFPDNPPRPFMGADGHVWLWASNSDSTGTSGTYGSYIRKLNDDLSGPLANASQCTVAFTYTPNIPSNTDELTSVASYTNLLWPVEFWSNGQTGRDFQLTVLIHNEFHGQQLTDCPSGSLAGCWYANVIAGQWDQQKQAN